jgi:hypothetical protein
VNGIQLDSKLDTLLSDCKAIQDLENKFWSMANQKHIAMDVPKVRLWKTAQRSLLNAFYQFHRPKQNVVPWPEIVTAAI